jgi:hypothetical protein
MSYENNQCPCGGRKERETMLCAPCVAATESTIEAAVLADTTRTWQTRRNAGIRLIAMVRKRDQKLALRFQA